MASGNAIRGTRVGSSPVRWVDATAERTEAVPRRAVSYWCANGHHTEHAFAADVPCRRPCGTAPAAACRPARTSRTRRRAPQRRAVQDPPRVREGAAQRRRRRGDPRRGACSACAPAAASQATAQRRSGERQGVARRGRLSAGCAAGRDLGGRRPVQQPQRAVDAVHPGRGQLHRARRRPAPCPTAPRLVRAGGDQPDLLGGVDRGQGQRDPDRRRLRGCRAPRRPGRVS